MTIFNRRCIFKGLFFQCHVSFQGCIGFSWSTWSTLHGIFSHPSLPKVVFIASSHTSDTGDLPVGRFRRCRRWWCVGRANARHVGPWVVIEWVMIDGSFFIQLQKMTKPVSCCGWCFGWFSDYCMYVYLIFVGIVSIKTPPKPCRSSNQSSQTMATHGRHPQDAAPAAVPLRW